MNADRVFSGSVAEIYDRLLVPLIFEPYALDLADRISGTEPRRVLETAAGTGALTRALASRLPGSVTIVATDLNQPMLDRAVAQHGLDRSLTWRQTDALALPFEDRSFDVVACQFGVMFFPDKIQGYREAHRVLETGGHFLFNVWDRLSENEFADGITTALAAMFPSDPPRFLDRAPYGHGDPDAIREQLTAAGFSRCTIDAVDATSRAPSPRHAAVAYCHGTPLRNEIEARDASGLENATNRATDALASRFGDGPIEGRIRAFVIDAVR